MSLAELQNLTKLDTAQAASAIGTSADKRESITGYQGLTDVDAIDATDSDVRLIVRDDRVMLVYVPGDSLPPGVNHATLAKQAGRGVKELRSRQGKGATLHVKASEGIAWSEEAGEVGFVELFSPMEFSDYKQTIYREPPAFKR